MDILKLKARPRTGSGKSYTGKTRLTGWIPAIYYGRKQAPKTIEVDALEFARLDRQRKLMHLIDLGLASDNGESIAVIKEVQRHVIKTTDILHIDFQHVAMDEKVTVECPLELVGIPVGVLEQEGVLGQIMRRLTVECLPGDIPEKIQVEVSHLKIGENIHIRDIKIDKITLKDLPEEVVAVVTHATKEIVAAAPAAGEAVAAADGAAPAAGAEGAAKDGAAKDGAPAADAGKKGDAGKKPDAGKKGDKPGKEGKK